MKNAGPLPVCFVSRAKPCGQFALFEANDDQSQHPPERQNGHKRGVPRATRSPRPRLYAHRIAASRTDSMLVPSWAPRCRGNHALWAVLAFLVVLALVVIRLEEGELAAKVGPATKHTGSGSGILAISRGDSPRVERHIPVSL